MSLITKHLSDSMQMWEALGQDGYPDVKGPHGCAYQNSPEAREAQREADDRRDAHILQLIEEGRALELGELLIDQATEYAKLLEDIRS